MQRYESLININMKCTKNGWRISKKFDELL